MQTLFLLVIFLARQLKVHPSQLGNTVHQSGHVVAKGLRQLIVGDATVLHDVMEEGGGDGREVQMEVGKGNGRFEGVLNVGTAGHPALPIVVFGGKMVTLLYQSYLVLWEVTLDSAQEFFNRSDHYNTDLLLIINLAGPTSLDRSRLIPS